MKKNKALFMWCAVAAVAVAAAIFDYQWDRRQEERKSQASRLLKFESAQIAAFELTGGSYSINREGTPLMTNKSRFEKTPEGWWIKSPIDERANQDEVQGFVEGLVHERAQEVPLNDPNVDWSQFGLQEPAGGVQVFDTTGASVTLTVGTRKNFQGDPYLRRSDEAKVFLGTNSWLTRIEKQLRDFRDKRILREPSMKLRSAKFTEGGKSLTFELKDATWFSPEHPEWKLDQAKVREVLANLVGPVIAEFKRESEPTEAELASAGLAPAALKIEARIDGQEAPWTADISRPVNQIHQVLMSHPRLWVAANEGEVGKFFGLDPRQYRDLKSPLEFDQARVARIEVKRGSDFIRAEKKADAWTIVEKSKADLEVTSENVTQLVAGLRELQATEFLATKTSTSPDSRTEIKLYNNQGETVLALNLGGSTRKLGELALLTAQSNLSAEGFSLEQQKVQELGINPLLARELRPAKTEATPTPAAATEGTR